MKTHKNLFQERQGLFVFLGSFIIAFVLCWLLLIPFWIANFLLFALPACLLLCIRPILIRKLHPVFFTLLVFFSCAAIGYVNELYGGWYVPSRFSFRIQGLALEEVQFAIVFLFFMLIGYEGCLRDTSNGGGDTMRVSNPWPGILLIFLFFLGVLLAFAPPMRALLSGYVYIKSCAVFAFGSIALAIYVRPIFCKELLAISIVGIPIIGLFEALGLRLHYWSFPGNYIGYSPFFIQAIPWEEVVYFLLLCWPSTAAVQSVFESALWKPTATPHQSFQQIALK